nr:NIb [Donkey orchid virus A]
GFSDEHTRLTKHLNGNLKQVGNCPGNMVTKHVVKGRCQLFELYLKENPLAMNYFKDKLGFYQKSRLNKEAYVKDIMKYSSIIEVGLVDSATFERATNAVISLLLSLGFADRHYVTDGKSIRQSLNMNAAVGALYSGKKKDYFEEFTDDMFEQIVEDSCFRLFSGKLGVWNGSLKAELRSMEKVQANKTRSFTAAPLDTLLGGKVCVDDFNNTFYETCLKGPWTVGISKFYGGWNEFLNELPEGWIYCDADGSQFDSSLTPYLINAVLEIRTQCMERWTIGERMLENLYTEIVYTPIATPDGSVIKKFKGNNSGQPSTVVDNTLMVMLAMEYSKLKDSNKLNEEWIKYFANGDDLIIAIHPKKEEFLDSLAAHFTSLGLKYDFSSRTRNKTDLWFMSHRGIKYDQVFIPKLEIERVVSILEWDRSTEPEHRLEALCAAMIEAWGYPELLYQIRLFYKWVLEQAPFSEIAKIGKAPYIAETALKHLYLGGEVQASELERYTALLTDYFDDSEIETNVVEHQ